MVAVRFFVVAFVIVMILTFIAAIVSVVFYAFMMISVVVVFILVDFVVFWVVSVSFEFHFVVDSMLIGFIFNNTLSAIRLDKAVHSLGLMSISVFPLVMDIVFLWIMNSVAVFVGRMRLKK